MRVRVEGRRGRPVEIVIDELVIDREVAEDPRQLEAALARELDRRLSLEPDLAEFRGRSGEMGRLVATEVSARMGPGADRRASVEGPRGAASRVEPSRRASSGTAAPAPASRATPASGSTPAPATGGDR